VDDPKKRDKVRIDSIIGQNIRAEREMRRMSREELAEVMDLTVSHMGLIERGERGATAITLEKLVRAFGVPVDNFFAEPDNMAITLREDSYDSTGILASIRQKIASLITRLDEHEMEFLIQIIKGIIALNHHREPKAGGNTNEKSNEKFS